MSGAHACWADCAVASPDASANANAASVMPNAFRIDFMTSPSCDLPMV
jgi:hypothetical protein